MSVHGRSAPGEDGHRLLLHRSEVERVTRLSGWVREGLAGGEKVVYVEGDTGVGRGVLSTLSAQGIDVGSAIGDGVLEVLSPDEFYRPGGQEALLDRVLAEGYPSLRISGEASSAYGVLTPAAHREIEDLMDRLCATRPVSALCQYAVPAIPGVAALNDLVGLHPAGLTELTLDTRGGDDGLVLRGAVDFTNVDFLRAGLVAAMSAADAGGSLRVDLSEVEHLSASACRAIAQDCGPFRTSGPRLLLWGVRPVVARVMRLCRLEGHGVEIVERAR
ncbi:MEDS domain-containing protein [Pseudonocardia humida]|uniref:MEDS domain-containing protein n=1 Tax=Pseudonocardia humida TaxID=2800819 RepID=A0ABT0ZZC4_9PSEU|nr:MEDS domain-containing protein [Pseudonocardia humida]MCO1656100.1 MEDS domain-containing protein [Pseudonocardia humida]